MKKYIVPSLAEPVGNVWKQLQSRYTKTGAFFVAAPLSNTPVPIYRWIVDSAEGFDGWEKTHFVLMDELVEGDQPPLSYVSPNDPASYEVFAKRQLLGPLHKKISSSIEVIKPDLTEIEQFDTKIHLLILALGVGGNYANVMPGTSLEIGWHIAELTPEFRQAHTQSGGAFVGAKFRQYGMSLGPRQVLAAENVVVIISGKKKRQLTKQLLLYDSFDPEFPLSIIYHPKVKGKVQIYMTEDVVRS